MFGLLLKEVQRIKSQGDYQAARDLVEKYGVNVNRSLHQEVLKRSEALNIAPYAGFMNPKYEKSIYKKKDEYSLTDEF